MATVPVDPMDEYTIRQQRQFAQARQNALDEQRAEQAAKLQLEAEQRQRNAAELAKRYAAEQKMMDADLARGAKRGDKLFDNLGRLQEGRAGETADIIAKRQQMAATAGQRSAGIQDVIGRREASLEGFTPQEMQAMRENQNLTLDRNQQAAMRALRGSNAASGVRGGVAAAQALKLAGAGQQAKAQNERDLFLQNIGQKQQNLGAYESSLRGAETEELNRGASALNALEASTNAAREEEIKRQTFNIGQSMQERFGKLATELGYGQLGSGQRGAIGQQLAAELQAQSAKDIAEGGKK